MTRWIKMLLATVTLSAVAACGGHDDEPKNVLQTAESDSRFSILVEAVVAADLAPTLNGNGPFTVFAPTNDAFAKLPAGTVETLVMPENKDQLTKILTCHVVGAQALAADVVKMVADGGGMHKIMTVGGCELTASVVDGMVKITDGMNNVATVTIADVMQSNGVIHVIDTVLLPKM